MEEEVTETPPTPHLELREWGPLSHLMSRIPLKAQKGLSTLPLQLTTVAAMGEFIALGTNVGLVYWFNRASIRLDRLKTKNTSSPISALSLIFSPDMMVGVGNTQGELYVFHILHPHSSSNSSRGDVTNFQLNKLHASKISTLQWSSNGLKLFSGDTSGVVGLTELNFDTGTTYSRILLQDKDEIVQFSYCRKYLLVCSTIQSTIIYISNSHNNNSDDHNRSTGDLPLIRVGSQERKMGRFGGLWRKGSLTEPLTLYSARPGGRLWVANTAGLVHHTIKFKDALLHANHTNIPLNRPSITPPQLLNHFKPRTKEFQFGLLLPFNSHSLITFQGRNLYILDPINTKLLATCCNQLAGILDVAVNVDDISGEIFVLESHRNLIRLSPNPDPFPTTNLEQLSSSNSHSNPFNIPPLLLPGHNMMMSMSESILGGGARNFTSSFQQPLQLLTSTLKETSRLVRPPAAAVHASSLSILDGFKQVFIEGDVRDGRLLTSAAIPLHAPPHHHQNTHDHSIHEEAQIAIAQIATEEDTHIIHDEMEDMIRRDKFQHISHLPFDDVLLPQSHLLVRPSLLGKNFSTNGGKKKAKNKVNGGIKTRSVVESGDNLSLSSLPVCNKSEEDTDLLIIKDGTVETSATLGQNGETTATRSGLPNSMSQSWSVGQGTDRADAEGGLLENDLESKEEILARKLNWPELLPDFKKSLFTHSKHTPEPPFIVPVNIPAVNKPFEDEEFKKPVEEQLSPLEESLDIYTKYNNESYRVVDDQDEVLSFGPPSSFSNSSGHQFISLANLQPKIVEIEESSSTTGAGNDLVPVRDMVVEPLVMNHHDNWLSFTAPSALEWLAATETVLLGGDRKNRVYIAELSSFSTFSSFRWVESRWKGGCDGGVAISSCGSVVWRLSCGVLYSLVDPSTTTRLLEPISSGDQDMDDQVTWTKILPNVLSMSLAHHNVGWVVKGDGSLCFASGLLASGVVPHFELVDIPTPLRQIVAASGDSCSRLWGLTQDGRLYSRRGISQDRLGGSFWELKKFNISSPITCLSLGPSSSIWLGDSKGDLYWVKDEENGNQNNAWKVSLGDYLSDDTDYTSGSSTGNSSSFSVTSFRHKLSDSLRPDRLTFLLSSKSSGGSVGSGHQGSLILSGTNSAIWFALRGSTTIHVNKALVVGHRWVYIKVDRPLRRSSWSKVMGGSIYMHHGVLWLLDAKGKLFHCNPDGGDAKSVDLPTSSPLFSVSPAPDALWILNRDGTIYARECLSVGNSFGHGWAKIDLSSQEKLRLVHVSCGSDVAWGCDMDGRAYFRLGSLKPSGPKDMSPPWVKVEDDFIPDNCLDRPHFVKIWVGTNGSMVWGIDSKNNIYVREAVFLDFPIGTRWILVSGLEAVTLALSEKGVWALDPKGTIFRRYGISSTNFVGDYWKKVPGPPVADVINVQDLTVSLCDQLWIVDGSGGVVKHRSSTINLQRKDDNGGNLPRNRTVLDPEDHEWELIESLDLI